VNKLKEYKQTLNRIIAVAKQSLSNEYLRGMANGLICAKRCLLCENSRNIEDEPYIEPKNEKK